MSSMPLRSSADSQSIFSVQSLDDSISDGSYTHISHSDDAASVYDSDLTPSPTPSFPTGLGDDSYFSQRPGHSDDGQISSSPSRSFLSQSSQSEATQYANESLLPLTQFDFPDPLPTSSSSPPSPALSQSSVRNSTENDREDTSSNSSVASSRLTPNSSRARTAAEDDNPLSEDETSEVSCAQHRQRLAESYTASDTYISSRLDAIAANNNLSASASFQIRPTLAAYQTLSDRSDAHSELRQNPRSVAPYLAPEGSRSKYDRRFDNLRGSISALTDPSVNVLSKLSWGLSSRKVARQEWEKGQSQLVSEADNDLSQLAWARVPILEENSYLDSLVSARSAIDEILSARRATEKHNWDQSNISGPVSYVPEYPKV
jgi:hypothetical protein